MSLSHCVLNTVYCTNTEQRLNGQVVKHMTCKTVDNGFKTQSVKMCIGNFRVVTSFDSNVYGSNFHGSSFP